MINRKISMTQDLDSFDLRETKRNINNYFDNLEKLEWDQAKLNAQKGLTTNYDLSLENKNQSFIKIGKDDFNLSAIEDKDGEIKKHLAGFYWAKSILSEQEQLFITEYFANGKYEDEVVGLLGFNNSESRIFQRIKRRTIYKFAYVLNLLV